ncbi:hypothetical protein [Arhodomonas sp. SL1]|uniref:hypothetical protein n=1 Tax=Arhodomonas sp. SL1 TaxID=3425691 RepID=UPI003F883DDC
MSSKFDAYEIIGVIAPGSVFIFGVTLLFPDFKSVFFEQGFSVGDLGLFVVLSFVAGHLVQAAGNLVEIVIWKPLGGMPTDWLVHNPRRLLHDTQVQRLRQAVKNDFDCELQDLSSAQLAPIVREMYVVAQARGDTSRIDSFNRTYGLMRGVTGAFGALAIMALVANWPAWRLGAFAALAALIGGYRMVRFGKHYGRELIVTYLRLTKPRHG